MAKIISQEGVYNGHFKIVKYKIQNDNGKVNTHECFERGDAVAAIVLDTVNHKFLFTKQFRVGAKDDLIEIVAGTMDVEGESPENGIKREIMEELGYETDALIPISSVYVSPGGTSEKVHIFFAEVSKKTGKGGGIGNEQISTIEMSPDVLINLTQFYDAKTIIAVMWVMNESLKIKQDNELLNAFNELLDADHNEHFATRFNEPEIKAFNKMQQIAERLNPQPTNV